MSFLQTGFAALRALPTMELVPMIGFPAYWIIGILVFAIWCAIRGKVPYTERIARTRSKVMPRFIMEYGYWILSQPVWLLKKLRFTPDMVTLCSLPMAAGSGVAFASGRFSAGGWLLASAAAADAIDGVLARELGLSSDRGEFLDSVADRYADFFVTFGLLWYYRNDYVIAVIIILGIMGAQVMGYAKAKGEASGVDPKIGWMQRHERAAWLIIATCLSPIIAAFVEPFAPHPTFHLSVFVLVLIAFFTNLTAIARTVYVIRRMPRAKAPATPVAPAAATADARERALTHSENPA